MNIFFDTEFWTYDNRIELISIGCVRADGAQFYREIAEFDWDRVPADDWLQKNVRPHLRDKHALQPRATVARDLAEFAGTRPQFWAYYASYDYACLCMLFGGMLNLPTGWSKFVMDVKQYQQVVDPGLILPKQYTIEHHALQDAVWTKKAFEAVEKRHLERTASIQNI